MREFIQCCTYQRQGWSPCEGKISTDPPRGHPSWPPCTRTSWCYLKSSGEVKNYENSFCKFYQKITILQKQKVHHKLACIIEWKMFSFPAEDGLINGRIACYIGINTEAHLSHSWWIFLDEIFTSSKNHSAPRKIKKISIFLQKCQSNLCLAQKIINKQNYFFQSVLMPRFTQTCVS